MTDLTLILGLGLTIIGIILAVLALTFMSASRGRGIRGGGILLIGPIPILFGSDRQSVKLLILLATLLMLGIFILTIFSKLAR